MAHGLAEQARAGAGSGRLGPAWAKRCTRSTSKLFMVKFLFLFLSGPKFLEPFSSKCLQKKFLGEPTFFLALQHFLKGGTVVVAGHGGQGSKPRPDWRLSKASSNSQIVEMRRNFERKKIMVGILEQ